MQTSDALGAAGMQLGPNVAALTAELHTELGLPLEKTARVLETRFGLHVTKGGLVQLLHRTADAAAPAYAALCEQFRRSSVVTPDETGWRVDATRHWLMLRAPGKPRPALRHLDAGPAANRPGRLVRALTPSRRQRPQATRRQAGRGPDPRDPIAAARRDDLHGHADGRCG